MKKQVEWIKFQENVAYNLCSSSGVVRKSWRPGATQEAMELWVNLGLWQGGLFLIETGAF